LVDNLSKERERYLKRGFAPLRHSFPRKGKGELKRGFASLIELSPLPLVKGKGIKGIGLIK